MSSTPLKPMRIPRSRRGVTCSLRSKMAALMNENKGIDPLRAPASYRTWCRANAPCIAA